MFMVPFLMGTFANVFVSLRILLSYTLFSDVSGEQSFSKLKLIKTYLKSTISQEQLCGLVAMTTENDGLNDLDTSTFFKEFSIVKV